MLILNAQLAFKNVSDSFVGPTMPLKYPCCLLLFLLRALQQPISAAAVLQFNLS